MPDKMSALPTIPATASECIGCSANIMAEKKTLNLEAFRVKVIYKEVLTTIQVWLDLWYKVVRRP